MKRDASKTTPISKQLIIKYFFEFVVIILGVSISFWINERDRVKKKEKLHQQDTIDLISDLKTDEKNFESVLNSINEGEKKTRRLIRVIEKAKAKTINYDTFVDSIISIGYVYGYSTFFMNNATYKSLISNGRIQLFPNQLNTEIKKYYEYVSKRVDDNNHIVDEITLNYYNNIHPFTLYLSNNGNDLDRKTYKEYFYDQEIKKRYLSSTFLMGTSALRNRIKIHKQQITMYIRARNVLEEKIETYTSP